MASDLETMFLSIQTFDNSRNIGRINWLKWGEEIEADAFVTLFFMKMLPQHNENERQSNTNIMKLQ